MNRTEILKEAEGRYGRQAVVTLLWTLLGLTPVDKVTFKWVANINGGSSTVLRKENNYFFLYNSYITDGFITRGEKVSINETWLYNGGCYQHTDTIRDAQFLIEEAYCLLKRTPNKIAREFTITVVNGFWQNRGWEETLRSHLA